MIFMNDVMRFGDVYDFLIFKKLLILNGIICVFSCSCKFGGCTSIGMGFMFGFVVFLYLKIDVVLFYFFLYVFNEVFFIVLLCVIVVLILIVVFVVMFIFVVVELVIK